jgi:arylsulfatase A-like enzyme
MPTVLETAGFAPPPDLDGRSVTAAANQRRWIISESHPLKYRAAADSRLDRVERAIIGENFKLIASTKGKRELYDLVRDPAEKNNLYRKDHPVAMQMQKALDDWLKATPPGLSARKPVDSQMLQRLKSLGYAQ